jgi:hypothetical protein
VLYGSDFPYAPAPVVGAFTAMYETFAMAESQRRSIDRGAAEHLLPRLQEDG